MAANILRPGQERAKWKLQEIRALTLLELKELYIAQRGNIEEREMYLNHMKYSWDADCHICQNLIAEVEEHKENIGCLIYYISSENFKNRIKEENCNEDIQNLRAFFLTFQENEHEDDGSMSDVSR